MKDGNVIVPIFLFGVVKICGKTANNKRCIKVTFIKETGKYRLYLLFPFNYEI